MAQPDRAYDPRKVIDMVQEYLEGWFGDVEVEQPTNAYAAAAGLLMALGFTPEVDKNDKSAGAVMVRELVLADRVRTTTRSRRSL